MGEGDDAVLRLSGVERRYRQGEGALDILRGAELVLRAGEMVALVAPSGAGKSTLLHVAGLLERPDSLENVVMPQLIRGLGRKEARGRAAELLTFLGLGERLTHRPAKLSGGEQQRVAIARAVANAPRLLLADEPTGNLDPATAGHVFSTLVALVRASGLAALVATHNVDLAGRMDRRLTLRDGLVVELE